MKNSKKNNSHIQMPTQAYIWANKNFEKLMLVNVIMDIENYQRKKGVSGQKTHGLVEFSQKTLAYQMSLWGINKTPQMIGKWIRELIENNILSLIYKSTHKGKCSVYKLNVTFYANNKNKVPDDFPDEIAVKYDDFNDLDSNEVFNEVCVDLPLPINNSINNSIGLVGQQYKNIILINEQLQLKTFSKAMKKECLTWNAGRLINIINTNSDIRYFKLLKNKYYSDTDFSIQLLKNKDPKVNKANKNTYKKTNFHNFNETFNQYSEDELDDIIEKSQREKFKKCL